MTIEEERANYCLVKCKINAKEAYAALDPAASEPFTRTLLAVMDAIDKAAVELRKRAAGLPV